MKTSTKIAIRDLVRQLVLMARMFRYKFLVPARFIQPTTLSHACVRARVIVSEKLPFPNEFLVRSSSYRSRPVPEFADEAVQVCTLEREAIIHDARFVSLGEGDFLDVGNQSIEPSPILKKAPPIETAELRTSLILPWGTGIASYGDFVIKVLPKLARIWATIPMDERHLHGVCLPYFHIYPWALDYLSLLGIEKTQIIDNSITIRVPVGGKLIFGSGPKTGQGISHPEDIRSMLRHLAPNITSPTTEPWRKIYISRKMGRKMLNEAELIHGLKERGFEIVHLEDFSLSGQIQLFQEAAVITGPHGAGHANIIWCSPGTKLLEVFNPSWMHPCYALLSEILGINYHCLVGHEDSEKGSWTEKSRYGIFEDPSIDPQIFFRKLDSISKS